MFVLRKENICKLSNIDSDLLLVVSWNSQCIKKTLVQSRNVFYRPLFSDFSLKPWLSDNGYSDTTPLTGSALQDFLEVLQLSRYKETDCSSSSFPYFPQNERGWNTGNFLNLLLFFRFGVELPGQTRWCYGVIMQLLIYLHKVNFMVKIQNVYSSDK